VAVTDWQTHNNVGDRGSANAPSDFDAFGHAHSRGVVSCDVKPDNIFLAHLPDGRIQPKLVDFGLARMVGDPPVGARFAKVGLHERSTLSCAVIPGNPRWIRSACPMGLGRSPIEW